jgi:ABC-type Fe3+-siderophore transport system permease subunit
MQIGRGILMTLSVLPIVYTLRLPRWQAALAVGAILWVAGGLAPLIVPNPFMGTAQRMIHIVEILTQNAPLGATIVLLIRPGTDQRTLLARSVDTGGLAQQS